MAKPKGSKRKASDDSEESLKKKQKSKQPPREARKKPPPRPRKAREAQEPPPSFSFWLAINSMLVFVFFVGEEGQLHNLLGAGSVREFRLCHSIIRRRINESANYYVVLRICVARAVVFNPECLQCTDAYFTGMSGKIFR